MQLTFGDAEAMGKRKRTRKEIFLAEMDKVRDLPDRLNLEFFRVSLAHGHSCCCRGLWLQGVYETRGDSRCPLRRNGGDSFYRPPDSVPDVIPSCTVIKGAAGVR